MPASAIAHNSNQSLESVELFKNDVTSINEAEKNLLKRKLEALKLRTKQEEEKRIRDELVQAKADLTVAQTENRSLSANVASLQGDKQRLETEKSEVVEAKRVALQAASADSQLIAKNLETERDALKTERDALKTERDALKARPLAIIQNDLHQIWDQKSVRLTSFRYPDRSWSYHNTRQELDYTRLRTEPKGAAWQGFNLRRQSDGTWTISGSWGASDGSYPRRFVECSKDKGNDLYLAKETGQPAQRWWIHTTAMGWLIQNVESRLNVESPSSTNPEDDMLTDSMPGDPVSYREDLWIAELVYA